MAACGVEWPSRSMSSARDAPVAAASTAPLWRRSCQRRSSRLAFAAGAVPVPIERRRLQMPITIMLGGKHQRITALVNMFRKMSFDGGNDVRWDVDVTHTGVRFGGGDRISALGAHCGAADPD